MWIRTKQNNRTLLAFLLVSILSGIPLPVLDAHPTDSATVRNNPALLEHFHQTPSSEHRDVGDSEVHVHWVSVVITTELWDTQSLDSIPSSSLVLDVSSFEERRLDVSDSFALPLPILLDRKTLAALQRQSLYLGHSPIFSLVVSRPRPLLI